MPTHELATHKHISPSQCIYVDTCWLFQKHQSAKLQKQTVWKGLVWGKYDFCFRATTAKKYTYGKTNPQDEYFPILAKMLKKQQHCSEDKGYTELQISLSKETDTFEVSLERLFSWWRNVFSSV